MIASDERTEDTKNIGIFITNLPGYFRENGLPVKQSFCEDAFTLLPYLDAEAADPHGEAFEAILASIICTSREEVELFHRVYANYVIFFFESAVVVKDEMTSKVRVYDRQIQSSRDKIEQLQKLLERAESSENEREDPEQPLPPLWSAATKKSFLTQKKKADKSFDRLLEEAGKKASLLLHAEEVMDDPRNAPSDEELAKAKAGLKDIAKKALLSPDSAETMATVAKYKTLLDKIESFKREQSELKDAKGMRAETKKNLRIELEKEQNLVESLQKERGKAAARLVIKPESINSRPENSTAAHHNAVQTRSHKDTLKVLAKPMETLTEEDRRLIESYILENVQNLKTRMLRNVHTSLKRKIDLPATIKVACRMGGIPLALQYVKPKRSKANLILLLDISGSCKTASELMLTFMHNMQEVFPNGCRAYAFVNSLYDVTPVFRESKTAQEAIEAIRNTIPTKGVYSDYCSVWQQFYKEHLSEITSSTIFVVIGDGRNNRNPSGEDYVKAIFRKARSAYWLDTEPEDQWFSGDSAMAHYIPYTRKTYETLYAGDLLGFLQEVR